MARSRSALMLDTAMDALHEAEHVALSLINSGIYTQRRERQARKRERLAHHAKRWGAITAQATPFDGVDPSELADSIGLTRTPSDNSPFRKATDGVSGK